MKAIKYSAAAMANTWAKEGFLFENGIFLCAFKFANAPSYICREYDFNNAPLVITWGKGITNPNSFSSQPGAPNDYQTFQKNEIVDKDFDQMKNDLAGSHFWEEDHHPSKRLTEI